MVDDNQIGILCNFFFHYLFCGECDLMF